MVAMRDPFHEAQMPDPYQVLQVTRAATTEEIRGAYRRLALQYHPDKNHGDLAAAEEKFKIISTAYSILGDADKRRRFDLGGYNNLNASDFEVDVAELGKVDTVLMAMFSKLGGPVKTAVSKQVFTALESGWYQTQLLTLGRSFSGKVACQTADFYEMHVDEDLIEAGFCLTANCSSQNRLKLLLFGSRGPGGWELLAQEDSTKVNRNSIAGLYFLPFQTYSISQPSLVEVGESKGAEVFRQLDHLSPRRQPPLKPGYYLVGVYGDNCFGKAKYSLSAAPAPASEVTMRLQVAEGALVRKKAAVKALETEYHAAVRALQKVMEQVDAEVTDVRTLMDQREEIYSCIHHLLPGQTSLPPARSSSPTSVQPLSPLHPHASGPSELNLRTSFNLKTLFANRKPSGDIDAPATPRSSMSFTSPRLHRTPSRPFPAPTADLSLNPSLRCTPSATSSSTEGTDDLAPLPSVMTAPPPAKTRKPKGMLRLFSNKTAQAVVAQ